MLRNLSSILALSALASTAAAQLQLVQQTRTISGDVDVNSPSGPLLDAFHHTAPDPGPYTISDMAFATGTWGNASMTASQTSTLGQARFTGQGSASGSSYVPFGNNQGAAFGSSATDIHVTFDVSAPVAFHVSGSLTRYGDAAYPYVTLRQGTTTVFNFWSPGTSGTTPFQGTGLLAPGQYELRARANASTYSNQFFEDNDTSNFQFTFEVENPVHVAYCFGDGTGTACPCANHVPAGSRAGCRNSLGVGGKVRALGTASLSNDTLRLEGSQMPDSSVLYFQGLQQHSGGNGAVFGDGKLCVSGTLARLGALTNSSGASSYPSAGLPSISSRGSVTSPGLRTYQAWYRNVGTFCTPQLHNLTNAVEVTWVP